MAVESETDRAAFLSADEFGTTGVYTPEGGAASSPIAGIFDRPSIDVALNEAATLDARATFYCQAADLPAAADSENADRIAIAGQGTFNIWAIEPDGQGMALLRLGDLS